MRGHTSKTFRSPSHRHQLPSANLCRGRCLHTGILERTFGPEDCGPQRGLSHARGPDHGDYAPRHRARRQQGIQRRPLDKQVRQRLHVCQSATMCGSRSFMITTSKAN
jgi:hypothetical protein